MDADKSSCFRVHHLLLNTKDSHVQGSHSILNQIYQHIFSSNSAQKLSSQGTHASSILEETFKDLFVHIIEYVILYSIYYLILTVAIVYRLSISPTQKHI